MSDKISGNDGMKALLAEFQRSAEDAFQTMVFTAITCGVPQPKQPGFPVGAISGTIGITGTKFCGRLSLVFSTPIAEKFFRSMMMMDDTSPVNESEMKDAVGELANMVAGGAKARLQQNGMDFVISLPTVVTGKDHSLESPAGCTTMVVPITLFDGKFDMEFAMS